MTDLREPTADNIAHMIEAIKSRLRMATGSALQASRFPLERYDEIRELYELVLAKPHFSVSEVEALVSELGRLSAAKPADE
jgi:uncharacterized protein YfkK (UPF0435 family)